MFCPPYGAMKTGWVVAGIRAVAPGYRRIAIAPKPGGGLTYARARLDPPYGVIEPAWTHEGRDFELAVTIPPNTHASVCLPYAARADVNGPVASASEDGEDLIVELGSGRYTFSYAVAEHFTAGEEEGDDEEGRTAAEVFSSQTRLVDLIAHRDARAVLMDELPQLMDATWLSQTMGFPLDRAASVIPVEISEADLAAIDAALRQIDP
jgi:hypothetical protein